MSRKSGRKKKKNATVDESLFGSSKKKKNKRIVSYVTRSELERLKKNPNSLILTNKQLKNIVKSAKPQKIKKKIKTKFQNGKGRIQKIREIEKRKKEAVNVHDVKMEKKKEQLRECAQELLDENLDDVKRINSIILSAKCTATREKQIKERKNRIGDEKSYEKRMDEEMELERLVAISVYNEREGRRTVERQKAAEVLKKQIRDREKSRLRERQLKEMEQFSMKEHSQKISEVEQEERSKIREETKKLMEEISKINAEQIFFKQKQKQLEIEEDRNIIKYQEEKLKREEALVNEKVRQKAEKEKEIARIRALQKREYDKQAEKDFLTAKRWQEQREREYREKQKKEAERRKKMNEELLIARHNQMEEKERLIAQQIIAEKEQFNKILEIQKEELQLDQKIREEQKLKKIAHAKEVRRQIRSKVHEVDKGKIQKKEESLRLKRKLELEKEKLELIRARKLLEMKKMGIPEQYQVKLRTKILGKEALVPGVRKSTGSKI